MLGTIDQSVFGRFFLRYKDELYLLMRLLFAVIVFLLGAQKVFQLFGHEWTGSLGDYAGYVFLISAPMIALGFLTRLGAGALVVTMIIAYTSAHFLADWPHTRAGGSSSILWFCISGIIGVLGGGKYALDRVIFKRELL